MILEVAVIDIHPGANAEFEAAVADVAPLFRAAEGCGGFTLERGIENPDRYRLIVQWETVAHHMEIFRASPAFSEWRQKVGPFFAGKPSVEHTEIIYRSDTART